VTALCDAHDVVFFDLDGVVYIGPHAVAHAPEVLAELRSRGIGCCFVTNNASRTPIQVAEHLTQLGIPASAHEVVTGSQAGAGLMSSFVEPGSRVLAIGGPGVAEALTERGFQPVFSNSDDPAAVMQGFGPELSWCDLAEAAYALRRQIPWIATNMDSTFPTPRGLAPGNGSLVMALVHATGRRPDAVAGKPEHSLFDEAVLRTGSSRGLMVGDRLDTDIAGGNRAGMATLLVLTGVCTSDEADSALGDEIPTYVGEDLRSLLREPVRWSDSRGGNHA
jgi:HAD superfamily hydrolase (TIGR01450 family)